MLFQKKPTKKQKSFTKSIFFLGDISEQYQSAKKLRAKGFPQEKINKKQKAK